MKATASLQITEMKEPRCVSLSDYLTWNISLALRIGRLQHATASARRVLSGVFRALETALIKLSERGRKLGPPRLGSRSFSPKSSSLMPDAVNRGGLTNT